jgi:long-chain acyl-CoA synthetase
MSTRTLPQLLDESAARFSGRPAVQWAGVCRRPGLSFAELRARARHGAAALRAAGLQPGDRVLVVMDGGPEWAAAFFAVLQGGFVVVALPAATERESLLAVARHVGARGCVHAPERPPPRAALAGARALTTEEILAAGSATVEVSPAGAEDLALLALTSGSTARPKAVEIAHAPLVAEVDALLDVRRAGPDEALLSVLPPSHLFELVAGLLAPLRCGARVVYAGSPLPNRLVEALREDRITRSLAVPALLDALHREILDDLADEGVIARDRAGQDPAETARRMRQALADGSAGRLVRGVRQRIGASFRTLGVGGAALDPVWADVLAPFGISLEVGYGLTEAGPIVSQGAVADCPRGSVGRPLPGVAIRVEPTGEILVRSPYRMRGYFGDAEGTAAALDEGWLRTGDSGHVDGEGFLFVTGRLKDAIVTAAGETLHPEELERYYESPLFAEQCVVPRPGKDGNDVPTIVVVPREPGLSEEEVEREVARLRAAAPARCRVAGLVRLEGPLPRTALGKVRRRALAEALAARRAGS